MPLAESDTATTVRCFLKSAPGGFVVLRKLTYGESLALREIGAQMRAESTRRREDTNTILVDIKATASTAFGFKMSILDHNLQKKDGTKLNFSLPDDVAVLDPAVGNEVEDLINRLNDGEDMAPFEQPASSSSAEANGQSKSPTEATSK